MGIVLVLVLMGTHYMAYVQGEDEGARKQSAIMRNISMMKITPVLPKKKRGRPKGSKNKK